MVAYFEPALLCGGSREILLAPLPTRKQLWDARSAASWKEEYEKEPDSMITYGLAATGELVKHADGTMCYAYIAAHDPGALKAWTTVDWSEWCAGMDAMGGLVMLAASLTSQS